MSLRKISTAGKFQLQMIFVHTRMFEQAPQGLNKAET